MGIVAVPIAFAVTASAETLALGTVLLLKVQRRVQGLGRTLQPATA
jgi:hypothetical protein